MLWFENRTLLDSNSIKNAQLSNGDLIEIHENRHVPAPDDILSNEEEESSDLVMSYEKNSQKNTPRRAMIIDDNTS